MAFFKSLFKAIKPVLGPILSVFSPLGGALLSGFEQNKQASKARKEQERIQQETTARQDELIRKQEEVAAKKEAEQQATISSRRRTLLGRRGRRQTLFGSPLGVGDQEETQKTTLG